jgi:hypothetical protein
VIEAARLQITYLHRGDHPSGHVLKARLHDLACEKLASALGSMFAHERDDSDSSIWVIRRLDADVHLDVRCPDDDVVGTWARQLSDSLVEKLDCGDPDVLRFDSRAAYLARYVVERGAGTANGRWYFQPFEGLRVLPASAAIRTALVDVPDDGLRALGELSNAEVGRIASTLSEMDAHLVLGACANGAAAAVQLSDLIDAWKASTASSLPSARAALAALVELSRARPVGRETAARLLAMATFADLSRELSPQRVDELGEMLGSGNLPALIREVGIARAEVLAPLLGEPADMVRHLLPSQPSTEAADPEWRHTPFGGLFLLLPRLAELSLPAEFGNQACLRLWVLIKCFGAGRAFPVFLDPLVRELLGVDPDLPVEGFVKWQRRIPSLAFRRLDAMLVHEDAQRENSAVIQPGDAEYLELPDALRASRRRDRSIAAASRRVLRNFAWRLPGFSTSSLRHLFDNFLDVPARLRQPSRGTRTVVLGRAPLSLVLNLTGTGRDTYLCPWLDEVPFQLYPEV